MTGIAILMYYRCMRSSKLFGGIEAGGTKFVCATGTANGELLARAEIETTTPEETIPKVAAFFQQQPKLEAIGIGSFGPVDIDPNSSTFGMILKTVKPGWASVNLFQSISHRLQVPVKLQTDTDVAAIGEYYHGKALGKSNFIYLTIGTGVGGSIFMDGKLLHGMSHSEMGHIQIPLPEAFMRIPNQCTVHEHCLEGFVSGRSLQLTHGKLAREIEDQNVWALESRLIAMGITNILLVFPVELIILGGSVMKHPGLIERVKKDLQFCVNNYIELPQINQFIVHTSSDTIGVLGAIKLASL